MYKLKFGCIDFTEQTIWETPQVLKLIQQIKMLLFSAGKLQNIEGIAESTEDDINNDNIAEIVKSTTEDYHYLASALKKAPKAKTIPQGT